MTIETAYQALVFQAMNTEVEVLIYPASPTGCCTGPAWYIFTG
jgi:hypothetical protein